MMLVKGAYGFLSVITPFFNDFDWDMFRTKFWWLYVPGGVEQTMIIYIAAGIDVYKRQRSFRTITSVC